MRLCQLLPLLCAALSTQHSIGAVAHQRPSMDASLNAHCPMLLGWLECLLAQKGINDDEIFLRMQDLLAEAMAEGLSVQGALNALSLGAVRLYLRNDIGNPFVRAAASVLFCQSGQSCRTKPEPGC